MTPHEQDALAERQHAALRAARDLLDAHADDRDRAVQTALHAMQTGGTEFWLDVVAMIETIALIRAAARRLAH